MKVAVLVSGGVDSSVALYLLKEQGYDVTAFYLKIWLEDELSFLGTCPWQEDLSYINAVCKQIKVPLEVISLQKEYWQLIVSYTILQAKEGKTPNPDILCNQHIKFGAFLEKIDEQYSLIASGHYAKTDRAEGCVRLLKARDGIKDQTYFLSRLDQKQLNRIIFPLGDLEKKEVRSLAASYNIANKDRKDSQGICFLGKFKFFDFLRAHLGESRGALIEFETNKQVGIHNGFWFYTIGQRQGIGLAGGPWYVVAKDVQTNTVYISRTYYDPDKNRNTVLIENMHWVKGFIPAKNDLEVKMRHGKDSNKCVIEHISAERMKIHLADRDQGIAAGQFAVFYDGNECLGGGVVVE